MTSPRQMQAKTQILPNSNSNSYNNDNYDNSSNNNWAVLVGSSKYFFNYRHHGNILNVYEVLKAQGFDDDHIIVFDALQAACDPRNIKQGEIRTYIEPTSSSGATNSRDKNVNVDVITDYKGDEVTVNSFLKLLTGKYAHSTINSKKLRSDEFSNVVIYLSGHGGDGFFKFRDIEELLSSQLSAAIVDMKSQKRFQNLLVIADTCKAATLLYPNSLPSFVGNVSFIASSRSNENSFGWHSVAELEVAIIDRFSLKFAEGIRATLKKKGGDKSIQNIVESIDPRFLMSHASFTTNSHEKVLVSTFFSANSGSGSRRGEVGRPIYSLNARNEDNITDSRSSSNVTVLADPEHTGQFSKYIDRNFYNNNMDSNRKTSAMAQYSPMSLISDSAYSSYCSDFKLLLAISVFLILYFKICT